VTYRLAMILHFFSMALLTAGGFGGALLFGRLAAAVRGGTPQLPGLVTATRYLSDMARIGLVLMLVTGAWLLYAMHWVEYGMPWMTFKLTLYGVMWALSLGLATPAGLRLAPALARRAKGEDVAAELDASLARLGWAHVGMIACFVAIVAIVVLETR